MNKAAVITLAIMGLLMLTIGLSATTERGGLSFSFGDISIVRIGADYYAGFDVYVTGTNNTDRLGTGIILVNYNPAVFGESVNQYHNVIVTPGEILSSSLYPLYGLIVNDNQANRLAVTFEYLLVSGWGNRVSTTPKTLVNIKLRIQNYGTGAGLGFAPGLMYNQQYMDDNATLFSPVTATDTDNSVIPIAPTNLAINKTGTSLRLTWQALAGYTYTIYSATDPIHGNWLPVATGLSGGSWTISSPPMRNFYRITAHPNPGTY